MNARRAKKFKKFILPLTFAVGLASFPLGQLLFHQSRKAAQAVGLVDKKPQKRKLAHHAERRHQQVKVQKRSHKVARHKATHKKIARARSKPKRERYAH